MTSASTGPAPTAAKVSDPLALIDVDHARFFVGNAKQAAFFYAYTFGFQISQYSDLTTGSRGQASYLLTQGNIRLLLTTGITPDHPAQKEVLQYGDGIKDIALTVHPHPTLGEAVMEAAKHALGEAVHIQNRRK